MSRTLIDIPLPFSGALSVWPGDPPVAIASSRDPLPRLMHLSFGNHTGTHVDAPAHFIADGATVDRLPLETLIGPAWVVHLPDLAQITAAALAGAGIPPGTTRLLIRTDNSERALTPVFDPTYVALTGDAVEWLLAHAVRLVGLDAPSLDLFGSAEFPAHNVLLAAGVIFVERLALGGVAPGAYELICLPLPLLDGDGAPARAVLVREM